MNRAKKILSSLRRPNSLHFTQFAGTRSVYNQVTQSSLLSPPPPPHSLSSSPHGFMFPSTLQTSLFSSKPETIVETILSNDWSKEFEQELSESNPTFTHESVTYVLKKLDKDPQKASKFFDWVTEQNGFKPSSDIYSLILRIFARIDTMKLFWVTIKTMKERGGCIDKQTYLTILAKFRCLKMANEATALTHFYNRMIKDNSMDDSVKEVVELVRKSDHGREIHRKLGETKIILSDDFVVRVLKELRDYPFKSLSFFNWVGGNSSYKHSTITYNAIARVLGQDKAIEEFWNIVDEMKNNGHEMDLDTYIKISRNFQKNKLLKDAVKLYEHMMDGPFKPSIQDCSLLLRKIAGTPNPDMDLVFKVVKKYEEAGHTLSKTIYDGIHRSLTSLGRFDESEKILETMKNAGYEPDNITYSQLVFGLCKAQKFEEALKVMEEMEIQNCLPDIKTWTILIQGHCTAGEVDQALFCFAKMIEKCVDADADLLDVLINGFLSENRVSGAYTLLVEMANKARLRPWQATYKTLISKLLAERKLEEGLDLLRRMKKHNYPPFPEPFIEYISKWGTVNDAEEFLKALSVKDYPTISAYQHVFKSFFRENRHSEAKDLLYKCPHHIRKHQAICDLFGSSEKTSLAA